MSDDELNSREVATHLRNLAKRSNENKIRLTDVVLHLAISSYGKDRNECAICSDDCQFSLELPCGHAFHKSCIRQWFDNSRSCPVCRSDVPLTTLTPLPAAQLMHCFSESDLKTKLEMLLFYTAVDDSNVEKLYNLCQSTEQEHRIRANTLCSECTTTDASMLDVDHRTSPAPHRHHPSVLVHPDNHEADTHVLAAQPEEDEEEQLEEPDDQEDADNKRLLATKIEFMTGSRIYNIVKTRIADTIPPPPLPPLPYPLSLDIDLSTHTALVTVDAGNRRCTIVLSGVQYTITCS